MTQGGHITSSFQVKMVRHDWTEEETEYFFLQVIKGKNITTILDSKQQGSAHLLQNFFVPPSFSHWGLAERDWMIIAVYVLHPTAIVLCRDSKNIAFILRKTVVETQLVSGGSKILFH